MVLLDYLYQRHQDIVVAHVDYQKRSDSFCDALVIKDYLKDKKIIFEELIVPKDYYTKDNFQAQARHIRYQFFKELALKYQTNDVYVAHHKDDYLETYIFKKERGGLYDYFGIKTTSNYQGLVIRRPLLGMYREDIINYAQTHNINYHEDSSNKELIYTRNRNRAYLQTLSQETKEKLFREAEALNQKSAQEQAFVKACLKDFKKNKSALLIERNKFNNFSLNIKRRLLFKVINKKDLTTKHLDEIIRNIKKKGHYSQSFRQESNSVYLFVAYDIIYFLFKPLQNYCYEINNEAEYSQLVARFKADWALEVNKITVSYPFTIRNYQPADLISYPKYRLKLKKKKIPFFLRDYLPIIVKGEDKILMVDPK